MRTMAPWPGWPVSASTTCAMRGRTVSAGSGRGSPGLTHADSPNAAAKSAATPTLGLPNRRAGGQAAIFIILGNRDRSRHLPRHAAREVHPGVVQRLQSVEEAPGTGNIREG